MANTVTITAKKTRLAQYEATIVDYLLTRDGHFVVLSHDASFLTLLRMTLLKELGQNHNTVLTTLNQPQQLIKVLEQVVVVHPAPVLIIEHMLKGEDMTWLVRECAARFRVCTLVLASQPDRDQLMYLHEMGADNFVLKPVSTDTLIAKLAVTIRPQSRFGLEVEQAKHLLAEGAYDDCLRLCNDLLLENPASAVVHLIMGDVLRAKGRGDLARDYYETASSTDVYLTPLGRLAQLHGEAGSRDRQLACLDRMNSLSPLNLHRKLDMGELHLAMGNDEEAQRLFGEVTTQLGKGGDPQANALVGRIASLYGRKEPAVGEMYLRTLINTRGDSLTSDDVGLFNQLGISLRLQGKWQEAISEYGRALRVAPDNANLYYNMAMASVDGKEYTSARQYMLKALHCNPELARTGDSIALNMGKVFFASSAYDKALECLGAALEQNPRLNEARQLINKIKEMQL